MSDATQTPAHAPSTRTLPASITGTILAQRPVGNAFEYVVCIDGKAHFTVVRRLHGAGHVENHIVAAKKCNGSCRPKTLGFQGGAVRKMIDFIAGTWEPPVLPPAAPPKGNGQRPQGRGPQKGR